jgi:hypothetical protein
MRRQHHWGRNPLYHHHNRYLQRHPIYHRLFK